ncbi:caffeic acid 3-O-methyltransferase [Dorcoceras hygrometricum]|uniref:Caffeic acid 3-O-methyltransferase n=1 Tax=Dorcoceras hygrometricum TaxID=472368 RepID=A0A2Z7CG34_9LAMI|nr:caffeic acid 3-O-methyltransferase [Dorcoceras hygrometricum]
MADDQYLEEEFAIQLAFGSVIPMVLRAAIELDIFDIIRKAWPDASLSAFELACQLPTKDPDTAATMLDRILRLLAEHALLNCSTKLLPSGDSERRYSLAPAGKLFSKNEDGVSMAPVSLFVQHKVMMESWYHLKDAILEGTVPFNRAHGKTVFQYAATDPSFNQVCNLAMSSQSVILMTKLAEIYKGFEGLNSLVDVGGGIGSVLHMIVSKYPSVKAINFDLPHVIRDAPSYPGVQHIGGDMFAGVPKGDAIFMKWILHDWNDAENIKILKNCYKALPENGKVIICEYILSETPSNGTSVDAVGALADVVMLAHSPSGKERTLQQYEALAIEAGFTKLFKVCRVYGNSWIMEMHK